MQSRESDKFMVRLPDGWRDEIKEIAYRERRSMNAEILNYIERGIVAAKAMKKGEVTA